MFQEGITIVSATLSRTQLLLVLIVILRGGSTNQDFKGFMIQGRVRADDSPAGTFGSGTNYQSRCSGNVSLFRLTTRYTTSLYCCNCIM